MSYRDALLAHVERSVLRDFDSITPPVDHDHTTLLVGEWPITLRTLVAAEPPVVQIEAHVGAGLRSSARLLREINEINCGAHQFRCCLRRSALLLMAELPIESIEPGDIFGLARRMSDHAVHLMPLIQAAYSNA